MVEGGLIETEEKEQDAVPRKLLDHRVTRNVKWFNVKSAYGFIHRNDEDKYIFVHQSAIVQNDPENVRSLNKGEEVEFYVVEGYKGDEAYEVTGPNGAPVKASKFSPFERGCGQMFPRGRGRGVDSPFVYHNEYNYGRGRGRGGQMYGSYEYSDRGGRGRPFYGRGRGRGFRGGHYDQDGHQGPPRGSYRGRRGGGGGDDFRPRDTNGANGHHEEAE